MPGIVQCRWGHVSTLIWILPAILVSSACATGQYVGVSPYPGELGRVVASNLALTCPESIYLGPPLNRCADRLVIGGRPYWGYYASPDRFVVLYGPDKRLLWPAAGAVAGYAIGRSPGAAITGALIAYGVATTAEAERSQTRLRGPRLYTISNPTTYVAEIFDGRLRVAELAPHTDARIMPPEGVLTARVKIPQGGRLREVVVELQSTGGTSLRVPPI